MPTDYLVDCGNPEQFDKTIQSLGAAVLFDGGVKGEYKKQDGYYLMRVFQNEGYIEFAIKNQGYGTIIKKFDEMKVKGKQVYLGIFNTEKEAQECYLKHKKDYEFTPSI